MISLFFFLKVKEGRFSSLWDTIALAEWPMAEMGAWLLVNVII
jgi:hypothetical protein